ncbi:MAG: hypothetical protein NC918_00275 [Candidatus Omnitrophica bacterium]|nr:hypothetical protein [Candidatus Omnitrophota bacterium]
MVFLSKKNFEQKLVSLADFKHSNYFINFLLEKYQNFSKLSPLGETIFRGEKIALVDNNQAIINPFISSVSFLGTIFNSELVFVSISNEANYQMMFSSLSKFSKNTILSSISNYMEFLIDKSNSISLYIFAGSKNLLENFCLYLFKGYPNIKIEFLTLKNNPSFFKEVLVSKNGKVFYNFYQSKKESIFFNLNLINQEYFNSLNFLNDFEEIKINFV